MNYGESFLAFVVNSKMANLNNAPVATSSGTKLEEVTSSVSQIDPRLASTAPEREEITPSIEIIPQNCIVISSSYFKLNSQGAMMIDIKNTPNEVLVALRQAIPNLSNLTGEIGNNILSGNQGISEQNLSKVFDNLFKRGYLELPENFSEIAQALNDSGRTVSGLMVSNLRYSLRNKRVTGNLISLNTVNTSAQGQTGVPELIAKPNRPISIVVQPEQEPQMTPEELQQAQEERIPSLRDLTLEQGLSPEYISGASIKLKEHIERIKRDRANMKRGDVHWGIVVHNGAIDLLKLMATVEKLPKIRLYYINENSIEYSESGQVRLRI
ncbi:MAG: hypothetical protein ACRDBG_09495, partial [Waterburya sp.]